jgi:hypothetical protein
MTQKDDISDFQTIPTSTIPEVSGVRFYEETIPHLGEEHPELRNLIPSLEGAIHDTIANPTEVYASNPPHANSFKFCSNNHTYGNNSMVVAVKVVEGTSALLKTAYFTDSVSGTLRWSQGNG